MKKAAIALFACLLVNAPAQVLESGPFSGLDLSLVEADFRSSVSEANEDCVLVENYRSPKHAKPGKSIIFDGGTRDFFGRKYRLTVRRSLIKLGGFFGYSYGYELYFGIAAEKDGARATFSRVWLISSEELKRKEANHSSEPTPAGVAHR
jgi:hypothetical protein